MSASYPPGMPEHRGPRRTQACSVLWDGAEEPAWGSAAPARFWFALEQPGPWGHRAFTESRLDRRIGAALESAAAHAGGRGLLIRTVGAHRDQKTANRRVFLSGGMSQHAPWLLTGILDDPADLLKLPWPALESGQGPAAVQAALPRLEPASTPILLVCTNAKRDACCAIRGRALARDVAALCPDQVWECTHCGGHRFAPTGILLPSGHTLGRLTPDLAVAALRAAAGGNALAAELLTGSHNRGLSHLSIQEQAADAFIRERIGETRIDALTVYPETETDADRFVVEHRDGRRWRLQVTEEASAVLRRNSCITDPVASVSTQVSLEAEQPGR